MTDTTNPEVPGFGTETAVIDAPVQDAQGDITRIYEILNSNHNITGSIALFGRDEVEGLLATELTDDQWRYIHNTIGPILENLVSGTVVSAFILGAYFEGQRNDFKAPELAGFGSFEDLLASFNGGGE